VKHSEPPRYEAFVLRCWEVRGTDASSETTLRFSIEDSRTGEKHGFADVEVLLSYLRNRLAGDDVADIGQ
jgi:hypothetical protein